MDYIRPIYAFRYDSVFFMNGEWYHTYN